jgi:hypothetical protein
VRLLASCPTSNPEVQGNISSGPYPLTCSAWVILPGAYSPASTILQMILALLKQLFTERHPRIRLCKKLKSQINSYWWTGNTSYVLGLHLGRVASYPDFLQYFCSWMQRQCHEICWHCVFSNPFYSPFIITLSSHLIILNWYCIVKRSRDSIVSIVTAYGLDDRGVGVQVLVGSRIFSSPRHPDQLWGPPSLVSNGYQGLFLCGGGGGKQQGRGADHSPPASKEVKKMWIYTPAPPYAFMA